MRISIIVPVYNEATTLPGFLQATADLDAEMIFVDGGSSDETVRILERSGTRWIDAERGRAWQMNAGASEAVADILLFLHADTRLPEGALKQVRRAVDQGAVGGYFDLRLDSSRPLLKFTGRMITWRSRVTGVATGDQAIFVTTPTFERLGGYASVPLFEDLDMSRRLKRVGAVARLSPPVITSPRRWERLGVWRTILTMWTLRALYYCGVSPERLARYHGVAR